MRYYMGIDIGTSGCKAVIFDEDGLQISMAYRGYDIISINPGWAELDTDEVIGKCFDVIRESATILEAGSVKGLGISSQGEAFTLIDKEGKSLCNALVSSDIRAKEYIKSWVEKFGEEKLYRITGHTPHPMFSLFKLLWIKENMPQLWSKSYKILCFEDLLEYRLGIKDPSMGWPLAGRTMLFDVVNHSWNQEILNALGIKENQLAKPLQSGTVAGFVNKDIAKDLGLSEQTLIVTGGHDQPCSGLGAGAIQPGIAAYSTGTVECISPAFKKPVFSDMLRENNLCTYDHVVEGLYATVAFSLTGGNLLKWFKDEFGNYENDLAKELKCNPYELLLNQLPVNPTKLLVLPYFTPSGTPYFDSSVKAAILGLDLSTGKYDILKALLEGVALEMRLNLEILEKSGYEINELRVIGGGAKSYLLNELRANILGKTITIMNVNEAGCLGVAILARAAHSGESVKDISARWTQPVSRILPDINQNYDQKFLAYKKLYPLLKTYFF